MTLPSASSRRLPAFITDLWLDPVAFRTLIAACAAVAAVGLDPTASWTRACPRSAPRIKQSEEIRSLLMVGAVVQAGLLLLGGFMADRFRSERLMRLALAGLVLSSLLAVKRLADTVLVVPIPMLAWACGGWCCRSPSVPWRWPLRPGTRNRAGCCVRHLRCHHRHVARARHNKQHSG